MDCVERSPPTVTRFFSRIPNHIVTWKIPLLLFELVRSRLNFLQAYDIRLPFPNPIQGTSIYGGPQTIDVPADYFHAYDFIGSAAPLVHRTAPLVVNFT